MSLSNKTPAQLDREIAEALASKDKPTTWMQRKSLYARGEPSGCDTFLLTYLPYHEMAPYKSSSAYGYGSYEECFDTRALAQRRLQQLRKEDRIEWAKIYQDDPRYPMGRKLVDEWNEGDRDEPAHARIKRASKRSHSTKTATGGAGAIDTSTTLDRKFNSRQRDALTLSEKARQARGAAARWTKRSSALARAGEFRAADDAQTEAMSLGRMADDLEMEASRLRTRR